MYLIVSKREKFMDQKSRKFRFHPRRISKVWETPHFQWGYQQRKDTVVNHLKKKKVLHFQQQTFSEKKEGWTPKAAHSTIGRRGNSWKTPYLALDQNTKEMPFFFKNFIFRLIIHVWPNMGILHVCQSQWDSEEVVELKLQLSICSRHRTFIFSKSSMSLQP